jgi:hypothetical protein
MTLMSHPEYGTKEVDAEWQHKFAEHGWELIKTKEQVEAEIRAEVEAKIRAEMMAEKDNEIKPTEPPAYVKRGHPLYKKPK